MLRVVVSALCLVLLSAGGLSSQPIGAVYDLHQRYQDVEMIELVPGVEVPADQWPDDHVVTVEDLLAVGVPLGDAERMVGESNSTGLVVPCPWGAMKRCFLLGVPMETCCPKDKDNG